jgi:hypothetical protein
MLDLETMSTHTNAAVASLGAVAFERYNNDTPDRIDPTNMLHLRINLRRQEGRHFDGDTIYWWLGQSDAARHSLGVSLMEPREAALKYIDWIRTVGGNNVWSLGATFDNVIWHDFLTWLNLPNPTPHYKRLCLRTITSIIDTPRPELPGLTGHDALCDAVKQTVWLQKCMRQIKGLAV